MDVEGVVPERGCPGVARGGFSGGRAGPEDGFRTLLCYDVAVSSLEEFHLRVDLGSSRRGSLVRGGEALSVTDRFALGGSTGQLGMGAEVLNSVPTRLSRFENY